MQYRAPQATWGQSPSAVQASFARLMFLASNTIFTSAELRFAGQPRAAVPTWPLLISFR